MLNEFVQEWAITSVFAHVLFYDGLPLKNSSKYQRVFAHPLDNPHQRVLLWSNTYLMRQNVSTLKKRVNLTIEDDLYSEFEAIKELRNESSLSNVILDLAREALEINEDLYFSKIAEQRLKEKRLSHDQVWLKKK